MSRNLSKEEFVRIAQFVFEADSLRKIPRSHMQTLLTSDLSDNIASHSFLVGIIGACLAEMEGVDIPKVVLMCLLHDLGEARTGDHNWIHKKHVVVAEEEVNREQIGSLPLSCFAAIIQEYEERKTPEAIVAKDADVLAQVVLLKGHSMTGNEEAKLWLRGKSHERPYAWRDRVTTASAKHLCESLYDIGVSDWWRNLYSSSRRVG